MALFTDGPPASLEDLAAQDAQLADVAATESINVTRKLALAQEEIGVELAAMLARMTFNWAAAGPGIGSVVVTPALKLWHAYRALELVYRDAYNCQLNDRYAGKRDQFHALAREARERLIELGAGIASDPVPKAATPEVTAAAGRPLPDGAYYVSMAWVNSRGEEGAAANPAMVATAAGTFLARPGNPPDAATGWNVYAGAAPESMIRQNAAPIGTGQTWLQPALAASGPGPGTGQPPSYLKPLPRAIERG
jgi:hypothetical protein